MKPGLSSSHYASSWTTPEKGYDLAEVNQMGLAYARTADGKDKEDLLERIMRYWHPYLMKYLSMITRGRMPTRHTPAGRDAIEFLYMFRADGSQLRTTAWGHALLAQVCKSLHLGFKGQDADEIYQILATCLLQALRHYDPDYGLKMVRAYEVIANELPKSKLFTAQDVSSRLDFDATCFLHLLVKRGALVSVKNDQKKVVGFRRTGSWTIRPDYFATEPIGMVYFCQRQFKYYLHQYIFRQMRQLEALQDVMQLDHWQLNHDSAYSGNIELDWDGSQPDAGGALEIGGARWAADMGLVRHSLDLSLMDLDWVQSTTDRLFSIMTREERYLLYLFYVRELSWDEVALTLGTTVRKAKQMMHEIVVYLKGHVGVRLG